MSVNYNKSSYYIEDGYFYRVDGNNHKSRMAINEDEYKKLEYYQSISVNQSVFDHWGAKEWPKCMKNSNPEHLTIRRNKKK